MKHKHAEFIHAWADGAKIQWRDPKDDERWSDIRIPSWLEDCEYRIKPEPQPDVVKIFYLESHPFLGLRFSEEINPIQDKTNRISCTFDGETGKLKSAEVL
jgi:hypothetical protein